VRELARLRNSQARALGFATYRDLALHATEVDGAWLDRFLREVADGTSASFAGWKEAQDERLASRFATSPGALRPWHYGGTFLEGLPPGEERDDPFVHADLVALTRRTFEGVGLDVEPAIRRSDLFPREGKNQHAFCTHLDRAGDVRVLCNVAPNERWMRTMVHEYGHAAFDLGLDFSMPWNLVRPAHVGVTEAVAMLFGRLPRDPQWLERVAGIRDDGSAERHGREALLAFVRWALVVVEFERRLYEDPDGDLDAAWWGLVERLQGIRAPEDPPAAPWAAKIHVALFPVYYHSYLMGECFASQMGRHLREHGAGLVENPEAGRWLSERVFRPGASVRWDRLVERATGRSLEAPALLDDCLTPSGAL
jgi:peptidyl-dipeptidase A